MHTSLVNYNLGISCYFVSSFLSLEEQEQVLRFTALSSIFFLGVIDHHVAK